MLRIRKVYPGSKIFNSGSGSCFLLIPDPGSKRHRIPDPDLQHGLQVQQLLFHCLPGPTQPGIRRRNAQTICDAWLPTAQQQLNLQQQQEEHDMLLRYRTGNQWLLGAYLITWENGSLVLVPPVWYTKTAGEATGWSCWLPRPDVYSSSCTELTTLATDLSQWFRPEEQHSDALLRALWPLLPGLAWCGGQFPRNHPSAHLFRAWSH